MDSTSLTPRSDPDQSAAPRIIVVLETGVSLAVHSACADLAAGLADRTRMPVTLASIPACCLEALRPTLGRARESRLRNYAPAPPPAPMSAAPFLLREDGRPDWGAMWGSFCELARCGLGHWGGTARLNSELKRVGPLKVRAFGVRFQGVKRTAHKKPSKSS